MVSLNSLTGTKTKSGEELDKTLQKSNKEMGVKSEDKKNKKDDDKKKKKDDNKKKEKK